MSEDSVNSSHPASSSGGQEDVVAKYKRLLSMARSSLEANQATLATKDQQITQLIAALEEEKSKRYGRSNKEEDGQNFPRRILCRVDVEGTIWVLLEYESSSDDWKSFANEQALHDFIQRVPGVPLACPAKCLSMEESSRIVDESKKRVDKIVEEFRRYKVRMEISLKQKDADVKPMTSHSSSSSSSTGYGSSFSSNLPSNLEKALSMGHMGDQSPSAPHVDEVQRLKTSLHEQELKWKQAYEKLAKETEMLKTKGAESVVATQWRTRYETCLKDKEELAQKLELFIQLSNEVTNSGKTAEQLYMEMHEEYKSLRKRLLELTTEYKTKHAATFNTRTDAFVNEITRVLDFYHIDHWDLDEGKLVNASRQQTGKSSSSSGGKSGDGQQGGTAGKGGMAESKVQYVRQMIFQYLVCVEPEVKAHIEAALMAIFRFTDEEREVVDSRKKDDNQDTLATITNFLGSFTL